MATFFAVSLLSLVLPQFPVVQPAGGDARIAGQIVDAESHAPIAGAHVMLMLLIEVPRGTFGTEPRQAVSDASGQFVFEAVAQGKYRVDVEKSGFAPSRDPFDSRTLDVTAGQPIADLQIALKKGCVVAGRILEAGGDPLSEISVRALKHTATADEMGFAMTLGQGETNDLGEFRIAGLPEGDYLLIATPRPPAPFGRAAVAAGTAWAPTYYPGTTDRQGAQVVTLSPGQTVSGLELSMVSAPAFQVSGIVVDEAGTPLENTMVMLVSDLQRDVWFAPIMGQAGQNGAFQIDDIVSGAYRIMAVPQAASDPGTVGAVAIGVSGGVNVGGGFFAVGDAPSQSGPLQVIVENADVKDVRVVVPARR